MYLVKKLLWKPSVQMMNCESVFLGEFQRQVLSQPELKRKLAEWIDFEEWEKLTPERCILVPLRRKVSVLPGPKESTFY